MKKAQAVLERQGSVPDASERCQLYALAISAFTEAGYRSIGMDHFALPDDDLTRAYDAGRMARSFMGYTTRPDEDLVGLGHSSISEVANTYAQNARTLPEYDLALDRGELATCRGYLLTPDDVLRRFVIMRIMSADSLVYADVERVFGIDFKKTFRPELVELLDFESDGLLTMTPDRIDITPVGRIFVRNLAMVFDKFLREKSAGGPRFSRTV
jgi:oxygen-independent coproporphyrinogen-3 oxidase